MDSSATKALISPYQPLKLDFAQDLGVELPGGFVVEMDACPHFLDQDDVRQKVEEHYDQADPCDANDMMIRSFAVRQLLRGLELPSDLDALIEEAYKALPDSQDDLDLVVYRPSKKPLDGAARVCGLDALKTKVKNAYVDHFSNGIIQISEDPDYCYQSDMPSLVVQTAPATESSGIALSYEPKSKATDFIALYSTWGLAEDIKRRPLARDEYLFHKNTFEVGKMNEVFSRAGEKEFQLHFDSETQKFEHLPLSRDRGRQFSIEQSEAAKIAKFTWEAERELGHPLEVSWSAWNGKVRVLNITQVEAPEPTKIKFYRPLEEGRVLASGQAVGHAVATGRIKIVRHREDLDDFQTGEVLVAQRTEPDWEPIFRKASAIVTEGDRRVSHSTILAREMGIPAILGALDCDRQLSNGKLVTVACCKKDVGQVLEGRVAHDVSEFSLERMPDMKAQLMVNLSLPERALSTAQLPWAGAGLIRSEFMIGGWVKIHPMALLRPDLIAQETRAAIARLTNGHADGPDYFVKRMSQAMAMFTAAFWPRPVTLRLSDFKSNEYARLLGGENFEPKEKNSMLGWRGALRYVDPEYREAFELELAAVKKVREEYGFTNLKVMIPFCRTPEEGQEVLEIMAQAGLKQGENDLEVWTMAELPSNVFLAKDFASIFDGMSIGSSDLTALTLGLDRSAERVSGSFDEFHPALMTAYEQVVQAAHDEGKKASFCGQAASEDPEFAAFLVEMGVDILSLAPDALQATMERLGAGE